MVNRNYEKNRNDKIGRQRSDDLAKSPMSVMAESFEQFIPI